MIEGVKCAVRFKLSKHLFAVKETIPKVRFKNTYSSWIRKCFYLSGKLMALVSAITVNLMYGKHQKTTVTRFINRMDIATCGRKRRAWLWSRLCCVTTGCFMSHCPANGGWTWDEPAAGTRIWPIREKWCSTSNVISSHWETGKRATSFLHQLVAIYRVRNVKTLGARFTSRQLCFRKKKKHRFNRCKAVQNAFDCESH